LKVTAYHTAAFDYIGIGLLQDTAFDLPKHCAGPKRLLVIADNLIRLRQNKNCRSNLSAQEKT